jgi:hypothetical protein
MSQDSSASRVTGYWVDDWDSFPTGVVGGMGFISSPLSLDQLWESISLLSNGHHGHFPWIKVPGGCEFDQL